MKDKFISILFVIIISSFAIFSILLKDKEISLSERRKLTTITSLKEDFNGNLDKYLTDQFPLRSQFLTLNNVFNRYLLANKEYNDVYIKDDYIIDKFYPLDEKSLTNFINKLNTIKAKYLNNNACYYSIIPDKSYFLDNEYLKIDYDYLYNRLNKDINLTNIDIKHLLTLKDYYQTDIHLKQDSYFPMIKELSKYLNFELKDINYNEHNYNNFKGSSFYKIPFAKPENLTYYTNNELQNVIVKHLDYQDSTIYKEAALTTGDPYNIFLSGPSSLIEITNANSENESELIIFRDSFGSSLAPLLVPYYKKIILIDLRYTNIQIVNKYIDFTNKEVLFLYSTLIVNNSFILK